MTHIFISYSHKDSDCVYKVQRMLEAQGIPVWIDKAGIWAGNTFPQEIRKGIREATAFMLFWSANSSQSNWVEKEIQEALNHNMSRNLPIIQVMLDNTKLHVDLTNFLGVALPVCSSENIRNLINKIPVDIRDSLRRKVLKFDTALTLNQQSPLPVPNTPLLAVRFMQSCYTQATIIGTGGLTLSNYLAQPKRVLHLIPQFLGAADYGTVATVYQACQEFDLESARNFLALHVTPKESKNDKYELSFSERGMWLDAINTTYEAVEKLVKRGGATLRMFAAHPVALGIGIGRKFDHFWHVETYYHIKSPKETYQLLSDTDEL